MDDRGQDPTAEAPAAAGPDEALGEAGERRREFIRRFGGYAASAPLAMFVLMSPERSAAAGSDSGPF